MLLVSVVVLVIFKVYSGALNDEFYDMASESMNDYTLAQQVEVQSSMREINATISAVRMMAESPDVDPEGPAFTAYIDSWNERGSYQISYAPIERLEEGVGDVRSQVTDTETLDKLKAGESVVSEVRKSNRLDGYFYSIAEPVTKDGEVVGVVRSVVDASSLLDTSQLSSQVSLLGAVLIKGDGTIVAVSEDEAYLDGKNLYEKLEEDGFTEAAVESARRNVENEQDVTTVMLGKRDNRMLFFTSIRLDVNDWNIVNFTEESTMAEHSQNILRDTVVTGALLIAISLAACIAVALVIGRIRRRSLRDAERYAVIAEFSDTVLFEYSYGTDTLELSSNARSVLQIDQLVIPNYYARNKSQLTVHEDDYANIRDLVAHPAPPDELRTIVCRARGLNGEFRWFSFTCRYLYDGSKPYAAVGKIVDVTQQREKEDQLRRKSQIDGLTKALNKVTAEERIGDLLKTCDKGLLFVMDIDLFKQINDEYGHSVGDRALEAAARALFDVFRRGDPVGRIGGDEFVAFAPGADADEIAETKRVALEAHAADIGRDLGIPLRVSVGVARFPEDGITYQELFDAADHAMYEEKKARKETD